jgi:hypothetical protein
MERSENLASILMLMVDLKLGLTARCQPLVSILKNITIKSSRAVFVKAKGHFHWHLHLIQGLF